MRTKKILATIFASAMVLSSTSCGIFGSGATSQIDATEILIDSDYVGSVSLSYILSDPGEQLIAETIASSFMEKYPNITVTLDVITGTMTEYVSKKAAAGNCPDVLFLTDDVLNLFAGKNYLADLSQYFSADNFDQELYDGSKYYQSVVTLGKYKSSQGQYAFPRDYSQVVMAYNKDLFDAAGIEYPADDWTEEDFMDICEDFKTYFNSIGDTRSLPVCYGLDWTATLYGYVKGNGGEFMDDDGNIMLEEPETKAAVDKMKQYYARGYDDPKGVASFMANSLAMTVSLKTHLSKYKAANMNFDFAPLPKVSDENPYIPCGLAGYGMFSASTHKKEAYALLRHIISLEGQTALAGTGNIVPIIKEFATKEDLRALWMDDNYNCDAFVMYSDRTQPNNILRGLSKTSEQENITNYLIGAMREYMQGKINWSEAVKSFRTGYEASMAI